ncbi:MAG: TerB family tellurite resistance protein [Verrucomicrobiota bacterium]|jgi:uncharacterized tellurite resistance protein B-like protein|nr:TerB family tellurite resistance protein [Verrucomicrobiota bacterium]
MGVFDNFFGDKTGDKSTETEDTQKQINMACAALLLEVAEADYVDDPNETRTILRALESELNLKQSEVSALLARAKSETEGATDLFPYTHLINQRCAREQKCAILTAMWRVAFADGNLDMYEEHLIRRVTELLHLDHSDFIDAKQTARPKEY